MALTRETANWKAMWRGRPNDDLYPNLCIGALQKGLPYNAGMGLLLKVVLRICGYVATASIGGGVLLWLESKDIYLARWVAHGLGFAESAVMSNQAAFWLLVGLTGLIGLWAGPALYALGSKKRNTSTNAGRATKAQLGWAGPEPERYTAEEIAADLSTQHGKEYTPQQVVRMFRDRGFAVESETKGYYPAQSPRLVRDFMDVTDSHPKRTTYWISRADRERFESGESGRILLRDAVAEAYEETRGTFVAHAAEELGHDGIAGWYAAALTKDGDLGVYGRTKNTSIMAEIPHSEIKSLHFANDANELKSTFDDGPHYYDLEIDRDEFLRRLRVIKSWN